MLNVDFFSYLSGEFQVLRRVGVRFNGLNLERAVVILSCKEIWKISIIRDSKQYAHAWDEYILLDYHISGHGLLFIV